MQRLQRPQRRVGIEVFLDEEASNYVSLRTEEIAKGVHLSGMRILNLM
jgi:predicted peroxiredoxin